MLCAVLTELDLSATKETKAIEIRVDALNEIDVDALRAFLRACSCTTILTLKKREVESPFLEELLKLQPDWITVEMESMPKILAHSPRSKILCSYHNFEETPQDLEAILNAMRCYPADAYKMATMANSTLDALRMVRFARKEKILGICMGELGQITRILAPLSAAPFYYTYPSNSSPQAPGQLSIDALRNTYRIEELNAETELYGLIGDPVTRSVSHLTHNRAYKLMGKNAVYVKMIVNPYELEEFLPLAREVGFKGLSVTMPLKEEIMRYIDRIDPEAQKMGAVNTLVFGEEITGYNTDAKGALDAIEEHLPVQNRHCLVLGAGGAARAIAYEMKRRGARLTILNRTKERALQLASELGGTGRSLDEEMPDYDVLVNATSQPDPIPREKLKSNTLFMEINSAYHDTALIQEAAVKNCTVVKGLDMFIRQAKGQFRLWFGEGEYPISLHQ